MRACLQVEQLLECSLPSHGRAHSSRHQSQSIGHQNFPTAGTTSVNTPLEATNKGSQILRSMGWQEGTGLGVAQQGSLLPISLSTQNGRQGLGT